MLDGKINPNGRKAIGIIVSAWVELYSDADRSPPAGFSLVFPYTGYREATISMTRTDFDDPDSLNYLVDWNKNGPGGVYVGGPPPIETESHELHEIVKTIHKRLVEEGFNPDDHPWNCLNPSWIGYQGRKLSYNREG